MRVAERASDHPTPANWLRPPTVFSRYHRLAPLGVRLPCDVTWSEKRSSWKFSFHLSRGRRIAAPRFDIWESTVRCFRARPRFSVELMDDTMWLISERFRFRLSLQIGLPCYARDIVMVWFRGAYVFNVLFFYFSFRLRLLFFLSLALDHLRWLFVSFSAH